MTAGTDTCRSCGDGGLKTVLDLGRTPLANELLMHDQIGGTSEPTYPLVLTLCPSCTLLQITETVPPDHLFSDYLYFSSYSETMVEHARILAEKMIESRRLGEDHLAMEIASNDGYLLQWYQSRGVPVLGIEPAKNVARVAESERNVRTLSEFFSEGLASRLAAEGTRADVLHAHNVLAHVPDLNGVVKGMRVVLRDTGVVVVEVPYVKDMLDRTEFDTIYHEHLCYFSLTSLDPLFTRNGLKIAHVEKLPIHGGSLRLMIEPENDAPRPDSVFTMLQEEYSAGLGKPAIYESFADRVEERRDSLHTFLTGLKGEGRRIAAYGAAAKGSTLLNTLRLDPGTIEYVADRNPHKQGRFMPGVQVPIVPPERLLEAMPDDVLILAWNIADEIIEQQQEYRRRGGRFIIPLPELRVV